MGFKGQEFDYSMQGQDLTWKVIEPSEVDDRWACEVISGPPGWVGTKGDFEEYHLIALFAAKAVAT